MTRTDDVQALEARLAALETLMDVVMGKLYAAHADFAEEIEEMLNPKHFPGADEETLIPRARLELAFRAAWERLRKAREQALAFQQGRSPRPAPSE